MRRYGHVLLVAGTLGALVTVAAPQASAVTQASLSLNSTVKSVTSSTGKTLKVYVSGYKSTTQGSTDKVQGTVNLVSGTPYGNGESHSWHFVMNRSSLTYSSGKGKFTTASSSGSQISPFGSFSLTFTRSSQATRNCNVSGTSTTVKGTLKGSFHFKTGSKAWGSVGANTFAFPTPNYVYISNGCNDGEGTGGLPLCYTALGWTGPFTSSATSTVYAYGSTSTYSGSTKTSSIAASRTVQLSNPTGATRSDSLRAPAAALTVNSTGSLVIKTKSGTRVHGSAKITKGTVSTYPGYTCKTAGGAHKTEKSTSHSGTFSSPSGSHLTFNFQITPDYTAPGSGTGSWSRSTFA